MFRWRREAARGPATARGIIKVARDLRARVSSVVIAALAFSFGALLFLPACGKKGPQPEDALLRLSQRNEPATLDPHLATLPDEFFILRALSEGLTTPNFIEGPPLPGVAETWSASPDGRRHTFKLRRDAAWSNGEPVTARDFIFSFQRALTPAIAAPKAQLFFIVKNAARFYRGELNDFAQVGFSAPDDHTLIVELEEPAASLPALAASGAWLPVHRATLEKFGGATTRDGTWTRPGNFVGNGPFVLTEWRPNQHLTAIPNPHYHTASRIGVGALRFQIYDSGDTEERAFRGGQVDVTLSVPSSKLENYAHPMLRRQPLHETRFLALNATRPPLNDQRVRQALSLALDRTALVTSVLRGGQQPALNFVPPGLGGYTGEPRLREDAAEARRLLAAAGFPEGKGFPRLELSAWAINPITLEAIQQMWRRELGIETSIVQREGKVHMAAVLSGDFAIAFLPAIPDFDDASALFNDWLTGATGNFSRWSNAQFDQLVREAGRTTDTPRRNELYRAAEEILLAELPVVPLYFNSQDYLVAPRVRGWRQDALWNRFYLDVTLQNEDPTAGRSRQLRAQRASR
ncbi:MAG: peptide ABC transporter substrate-binding protein [Opitutus sp.]|nr:peptide ABC transporter substrate-binding protein [Opitutus sp.]